MDALCDPRAFLSAQEKRAEQLKALGIEETDISGDVIESKGGDAKKDEKGGKGGKKEEKKGKQSYESQPPPVVYMVLSYAPLNC